MLRKVGNRFSLPRIRRERILTQNLSMQALLKNDVGSISVTLTVRRFITAQLLVLSNIPAKARERKVSEEVQPRFTVTQAAVLL